MPNNYIQSLSKKHNVSVDQLEKIWDDSKKAAEKEGHKDDYDYITAIFKKMIKGKFGINENLLIKKINGIWKI